MILGPERIPISKFPRPLSTEILSRIANVNGDQDGSSPGPSVDAAPPAVAPIIGGADAAEYEYAWHLLLYYLDYAFTSYIQCGATIVNERTVMTAGHCVSHDTEQK